MIARYWHPSRRRARCVEASDGTLRIDLIVPVWRSGGWRSLWPRELRLIGLPNTPANRRHLRTLAIDWCAHGVSWCDATTRGGLPKRGMMDEGRSWREVWEATQRRSVIKDDPHLRMVIRRHQRLRWERAAVREVTS